MQNDIQCRRERIARYDAELAGALAAYPGPNSTLKRWQRCEHAMRFLWYNNYLSDGQFDRAHRKLLQSIHTASRRYRRRSCKR